MFISRPASPLAAVIAALERAAEVGELSQGDLEWSRSRLSARSRSEHGSDGGARRDDIVRAATRVFLSRGYHHATIGEIAAELSLTKAGVYHYFRSKQAVLEAVCDQAMAASEEAVAASLAASGTGAERLQRAAEHYAELFQSDERLIVFMRHYDDVSDTTRARLRTQRKRMEDQLRRVLEDGVRDGTIDTPDAAVAMLGVFGTVNWMYSWYERDGPLSPEQVRDVLVRQVLKGVTRCR